jgi:hypothetical protein
MRPIHVIKAVMRAWERENHEEMYQLATHTYKANHSFKDFITGLSIKRILAHRIINCIKHPSGIPVYDIIVAVHTGETEETFTSRLICEKGAYKPSWSGSWGYSPGCLLKDCHVPTREAMGRA